MAVKKKYQDIYPSKPLLKSTDIARPSAAELLTLEYFEAEPDSMPKQVFDQHHILLNLKNEPHRVENWRDGEYRNFIYNKNEIIVTPAGVESGWRWHEKSKVIVITLDPEKFEKFAQVEIGVLLNKEQLSDIPQFIDEDITYAGRMLLDALNNKAIGSDVMYESLARVFLIKLIQKYGIESKSEIEFSSKFTSKQYKKVLEYISDHFNQKISISDLASVAAISPYHFARLFRQTIGQPPHQFLVSYRIEQAKKMLAKRSLTLSQVAYSCGFSDQAHFSRLFKKHVGQTPTIWQKSQ